MKLLKSLDVLVCLHFGVVFLLAEDVVLGSLLLDLGCVLLLEGSHLVLVVVLLRSQLEDDLVGHFFDLSLQLQELTLLLVEERPGHQDLISQRQDALLVALGCDSIPLPDVEDEETAIFRASEEIVVIKSHPYSRHRGRVTGKLIVVAIQRELVAAHRPRCIWLGNTNEKSLGRVGEHDLSQCGVGIYFFLRLSVADLPKALV
mmetsp:Transcript_41827/g.89788  ORF Transcript_41827/g.89788 Transcript_41827/m.89788 type:complete len:203 (-) Transcript_41827:519-1127(-)